MSDDALRAECEAWLKALANTPRSANEMLLEFAKAQRAAEVRAIQDEYRQRKQYPGGTSGTLFIEWLDQRAKEWET